MIQYDVYAYQLPQECFIVEKLFGEQASFHSCQGCEAWAVFNKNNDNMSISCRSNETRGLAIFWVHVSDNRGASIIPPPLTSSLSTHKNRQVIKTKLYGISRTSCRPSWCPRLPLGRKKFGGVKRVKWHIILNRARFLRMQIRTRHDRRSR